MREGQDQKDRSSSGRPRLGRIGAKNTFNNSREIYHLNRQLKSACVRCLINGPKRSLSNRRFFEAELVFILPFELCVYEHFVLYLLRPADAVFSFGAPAYPLNCFLLEFSWIHKPLSLLSTVQFSPPSTAPATVSKQGLLATLQRTFPINSYLLRSRKCHSLPACRAGKCKGQHGRNNCSSWQSTLHCSSHATRWRSPSRSAMQEGPEEVQVPNTTRQNSH